MQRHPDSKPIMAIIRYEAKDEEARLELVAEIDKRLGRYIVALEPDGLFEREVTYTTNTAPVDIIFGCVMRTCLFI